MDKQFHYVYRTTHRESGKFYIGKHTTYNLDDGYLGSGLVLHNMITKYGRDAFEHEILKFFDTSEEAFAYEKIEVEKHFGSFECLNLCDGGKGSGWTSVNHDPERLKARSEAIRKAWQDPKLRSHHSETRKKFWNTPEGRRIKSETSKKVWADEVSRKKRLSSPIGAKSVRYNYKRAKAKLERLERKFKNPDMSIEVQQQRNVVTHYEQKLAELETDA